MVGAVAVRRLPARPPAAALGARRRAHAERRPAGADRARPGLSSPSRRHAPARPLVFRHAWPEEYPPRTAGHGLIASGLPAAHRPVPYRAGAGRLCPALRGSDLYAAAGGSDCQRAKAIRAAGPLHPLRGHHRSTEGSRSAARRLRAVATRPGRRFGARIRRPDQPRCRAAGESSPASRTARAHHFARLCAARGVAGDLRRRLGLRLSLAVRRLRPSRARSDVVRRARDRFVGEAGVVLRTESIEELTQAMERLLRFEYEQKRLRAAGLLRAKAFSIGRLGRETVEVYRQALAA